MTNAELAILSLIAEKSSHGYQIEKTIDDRNMRAWTEIGFSSIYRILKKLEQDGLIKGRPGAPEGRGPARLVYHLTPEGKKAWYQASLNALSEPTMKNSTFLLGLDNLYDIAPDDAVAALSSYKVKLTRSRDFLNEHLSEQETVHFFYGAFFDYMLTLLTAEIDWVSSFIDKMHQYQSKQGEYK